MTKKSILKKGKRQKPRSTDAEEEIGRRVGGEKEGKELRKLERENPCGEKPEPRTWGQPDVESLTKRGN